ncbi:MAG: amidohydrolase [Dehalococcoidia bacterium]
MGERHYGQPVSLPGMVGSGGFLSFVDAHLHLLALASRLVGVEVAPPAVVSLPALQERLRQFAQNIPPGQWLRGWGYDEFVLGRHPDRYDLDAATPNHPVRLVHRSGHASVLNSLALRLAGISRFTDDPPYGLVERDLEGEPTGLFLGLEDWLEGRLPPIPPHQIEEGLRQANALLMSKGITLVHDATAANDLERFSLLLQARRRGILTLALVFMPGIAHLEAFVREGLLPGRYVDGIWIGQSKVLITPSTGGRLPSVAEVVEQVRWAMGLGWAVAIHAVEKEALAVATQALRLAGPPPGRQPHRIEHASECPPSLVEAIKASGAWVVTNPLFLYYSGPRYLATTPAERLPYLYPLRSLWSAGVCLAFGSDAPVTLPDPALGVQAAVERKDYDGIPINAKEGIPLEAALWAHTSGGWRAAGLEGPDTAQPTRRGG